VKLFQDASAQQTPPPQFALQSSWETVIGQWETALSVQVQTRTRGQ